MRRREFIALLSSAAGWPVAARAQQPGTPVIGFLGTRAPGDDPQLLTEFRRGLKTRAMSRARTWRWNTASRRINTTGCHR